jgi:hypothetical protein
MKTLMIVIVTLPFAFSVFWFMHWVVKIANAKYTNKNKKEEKKG